MNHLLRRPRPKRTTPPSNFDSECAHCSPHGWHGLECRNVLCHCPTSWVEPA